MFGFIAAPFWWFFSRRFLHPSRYFHLLYLRLLPHFDRRCSTGTTDCRPGLGSLPLRPSLFFSLFACFCVSLINGCGGTTTYGKVGCPCAQHRRPPTKKQAIGISSEQAASSCCLASNGTRSKGGKLEHRGTRKGAGCGE